MRDELTERAALAFHQYLCRRYPGVVWVRVRDDERDDRARDTPATPPSDKVES